MKLNKLSLSLAITLALGSTFGMAHAETTATQNKTTTVTNTTVKPLPVKATTAKTTPKATAQKIASTDKMTAEKNADTETKAATATKSAAGTKATAHTAAAAKAEAKPVTGAKTAETATTHKTVKENLPVGVYSDTKDSWARDAIQAMTQAGYLSGYSDNTFKPSQQITREQAAAIYGKVLQSNLNTQDLTALTAKEEAAAYSDVAADRWSNSAIKLVSAAGVMEGTSKTAFNPTKTMNREEFVASAANLAKKLNISPAVKTEKVAFKDEASISKEYLADVQYMAQRGIVSSGATESFNPKQPVTRAQAATILHRLLNGAGLATAKQGPTEAAGMDAGTVAEDMSKSDKTVDASKKHKDMKSDAEKSEKAAKEDAKKAKKEMKDVKAAKEVKETTKTEPVYNVRPVRRSTLKALDQKQQAALENKVFTELNKTYKTDDAFQDYGVMYWRDNQLHVALKTDSDIPTVKANLAARGDSTINNYVVVEPSQYSQAEYDAIDANFRNYYSKNEKAGNILATFPDVENNQLYAVVSTASKETQQGIAKLFGSKVKMTVKR
ncbi:S-layer homology domain-containing protein [Veillonella denticariosi]|uniref:S-layer homology domain-containing protein n=1 Tax=Veillonella denticariosi TaxID=419208 RepID=UPI00249281DF|nr:S-layer homology domain-containing protein [Veillonella denticariosi]